MEIFNKIVVAKNVRKQICPDCWRTQKRSMFRNQYLWLSVASVRPMCTSSTACGWWGWPTANDMSPISTAINDPFNLGIRWAHKSLRVSSMQCALNQYTHTDLYTFQTYSVQLIWAVMPYLLHRIVWLWYGKRHAHTHTDAVSIKAAHICDFGMSYIWPGIPSHCRTESESKIYEYFFVRTFSFSGDLYTRRARPQTPDHIMPEHSGRRASTNEKPHNEIIAFAQPRAR